MKEVKNLFTNLLSDSAGAGHNLLTVACSTIRHKASWPPDNLNHIVKGYLNHNCVVSILRSFFRIRSIPYNFATLLKNNISGRKLCLILEKYEFSLSQG